jgi:hypothetical protein
MGISQFIKNIGGQVRAKKYLGILPTSLPSNPRNGAQGDFLTANEISLYVNKAIAKRADKVSEIQFVLHDAKGNKIEKHPLLDLLVLPNSVFTGQQFWKLWQLYFDLIGETYIYVESTNRSISADPNITKPRSPSAATIPDSRALAPFETLISDCPIIAHPPIPEKKPERVFATP